MSGDDTINHEIYSARYAVLECPSHEESGDQRTYRPGTEDLYSMRDARRTSYFFSTGQMTDNNSPYPNLRSRGLRGVGAFDSDGATTLGGVKDGTSNSIAIGESAGGPAEKASANWGPWGLNGTRSCCMGAIALNNITATVGTPITYSSWHKRDYHINSAWQNRADGKGFAWVFRSTHPGGAQFVFCDGSGHFLTETMDYLTLIRLALIQDNEPVGSF